MSSPSARPGAALGVYPERARVHPGWLQQFVESALVRVADRFFSGAGEFGGIVANIEVQGDRLANASDQQLLLLVERLRKQFARQGATDALATIAFALVREVIRRKLGMRLFDEQLMGGWIMFKGGLAEMAHGEGKTLACLLPACIAALSGVPVHVISVNDRLAKNNADLFKPVFDALGVTVGLVKAGSSIDERRAAYQCDVTYCSSRQVAFDYMQDRILLNRQSGTLRLQLERLNNEGAIINALRLRGLCYAIVDDADSILIDESLSPLILSRSGRPASNPGEVDGDVLARTTFPRFFQRYINLCGAAANLREMKQELHTTYGLRVRTVTGRAASRRHIAPDQIFADQHSKWQAVCASARDKFATGQPVLVFTGSEADSELLGGLLAAAGVPYHLAGSESRGDGGQALSNAGLRGAVTVTSVYSGHGTDIQLAAEVRDLGGLHVILGERHGEAHINDRSIGHCARRGEPGSAVTMLSLEDDLAMQCLPVWIRASLRRSQMKGARPVLRLVHRKQQRLKAQARQQSLVAEKQVDKLLAFSGVAP